MADKQLAALPAGTALAGTEIFYAVQGGNSRRLTATQLKAYASDLALDGLKDVSASSPAAGDALVWDDSIERWVAAPVAGGGGSSGGVPNGGTAGQRLTKLSGLDQHVGWRGWSGARRTFSATMTLAAWTQVPLGAASVDTDSFAGTNNFVVPAAVERVRIHAFISPTTGSVDNHQFTLARNGIIIGRQAGGFAVEWDAGGYSNGGVTATSGALTVTAGDTIDLRAYVSASVAIEGWLEIEALG